VRLFHLDARIKTAARLARGVAAQRLGKDQPLFAACFITKRCNVRCDGCVYYDHLDPHLQNDDADTEGWLTILRRLAEGKVAVALLAGGEPFLRKDLHELLRGGHEAGISLCVVTNGMVDNPQALAALDQYAEWAVFSPHPPEEVGPYGEERWQEAWAGFAELRRATKRTTLNCSVTVGRHTADRMDEICERAIDAGADNIRFHPNYIVEQFPTADQVDRFLGAVRRWRAKRPDVVMASDEYIARFPTFFGPKPVVPCTANRRFHLGVLPDGTVSACCPQVVHMGNLLEQPLSSMLRQELPVRDDCYGCQRLDLLQTLALCGSRGLPLA